MLDFETAHDLIKPHMAIVCSDDKQFATVDGVDTNAIKVTRDPAGKHHYIPLTWVTSVDDRVHIDRPGKTAMADWLDNPPGKV